MFVFPKLVVGYEILSLWIYVLLNPNITMNWYQIMTILKVDIHHA